MKYTPLTLSVMANAFAVCRMAPNAGIPPWIPTKGFVSITRTVNELSIVCLSDAVPETIRAERGFRVLKVEGPLDFCLTGILLSVLGPLTDAEIPIFAVSTYDTDYVLVKEVDLKPALSVLSALGHIFK